MSASGPAAPARAIERVLGGGAAETADDIQALLGARGDARAELFARAAALRDEGLARAGRAGIITYSRKVFIPVTTLCRDRCHYCVFVDTPAQLAARERPLYMSPDQALLVARQGAALGCKEALLTLGDRPESRWPQAQAWLEERGFASTLAYVAHLARLITAETGLLVHLNPGVMTAAELRMLRPVAPSMGMMLETTSRRLFEEPGQAHFGSPDKDPAVRLGVLRDAGQARIPFTTGMLVGIGETVRDRAETIAALRAAHAEGGHIQEVIVQNFRAKPRTAMRDAADADLADYATTVAAARIALGADMRIQVPPNLSDPASLKLLVAAGADDWGGVSPLTADHVNPERPWPHLDRLAELTELSGFALRERLTAHPEYVLRAQEWVEPGLHAALAALADPGTGLAADPGTGAAAAPGAEGPAGCAPGAPAIARTGAGGVPALAETAAADPTGLDDVQWGMLLTATGADLEAVARAADEVRRYTVGEAVSIVINRNLASSLLRLDRREPDGYDLAAAEAIAADAWDAGVTEICVQGMLPANEDRAGYPMLLAALHRGAPRVHLHAYRPQDVADYADRTGIDVREAIRALRAAGAGTLPGTGVKVLSERVRRLVAPGDLPVSRWRDVIAAAHAEGMRTSSVLFYGHAETAADRIDHLRTLRRLQTEAAASGTGGGFTEFVPIPLPGPGGGVPLVAGRSPVDEHRAMTAVARLMLSGSIPHIQVPWPRLGRDAAPALLAAGADDLGGTLLDCRVRPDAAAEAGQELPVKDAAALAARLFRPLRQRTTDYGEPDPDRLVGLR